MRQFIFIVISIFSFLSCEKVIQLNLEEGEKQFAVDASLDWNVGEKGHQQKIILSKTTGYFGSEYPKATGASVYVANNVGETFIFEEEDFGVYICNDFKPVFGNAYILNIEYEGNSYQSIDTLRRPVSVQRNIQTAKGGLSNRDREVRIFFTLESEKEGQYFLVKGSDQHNQIPSYFLVKGDLFRDGRYFIIQSKKEWRKGDVLNFEFYHISERYFNYMIKLLAVANKSSGKPLSSPPARVQGNIVDINKRQQNPLGAFRTTSCLKYQVTLE